MIKLPSSEAIQKAIEARSNELNNETIVGSLHCKIKQLHKLYQKLCEEAYFEGWKYGQYTSEIGDYNLDLEEEKEHDWNNSDIKQDLKDLFEKK